MYEDDRAIIKNRLINYYKLEKEENGLTKAEIARYMGRGRQNITMILSEKSNALPSIGAVILWCEILKITPNDLFGWESHKNERSNG